MKKESASTAILKKSRELPFLHRHPWVFSGAIARIQGKPTDGEAVEVVTHEGQFVGHGLFNEKSNIRVRLYAFNKKDSLTDGFWKTKIERAVALRKEALHLTGESAACRLVNSEGDGLSGLTVDRYGDWLVVQFTALGLFLQREIILASLREAVQPKGIILRTEKGMREAEGIKTTDHLAMGSAPSDTFRVSENDLTFKVDLMTGQKTGFYLDQRNNRLAAGAYAKGRRCLDVCCYTGGFSLSLARGGAKEVLGIDSSEAALVIARENAVENQFSTIRFERADAFEKLKTLAGEKFDLVVLDPPRFAQSHAGLSQALKGYQSLNRLAVELLTHGGILVTCSCSGRVSREAFEEMLSQVARFSGRSIQILERRGPAADHPVDLACPESDYLKCYICRLF